MQVSPQKNNEKSEWDDLQEKPSSESEIVIDYTSICDIWKDSVTKTIRKVESQTPVYMQTYLQVHTEYLHCIDNLFGTCYLWQRQFFDKMGIDKNIINEYGKFCETIVTELGSVMDVSVNNQKLRSDIIIETMKVSNELLRQGIDLHAKFMTGLNSWIDSQSKLYSK